jgi:hypothetical protein
MRRRGGGRARPAHDSTRRNALVLPARARHAVHWIEVLNQNGEIEMSLKPMKLLRCRRPSCSLPRPRGRVKVGADA